MNQQTSQSEPTPIDAAVKFTASFGLLERLKRPEIKFDFIPVLDLMLLALLVSLLFSRFVMLPGVRVNLPETDLRIQHDASEVAVLTIGNHGVLFFDGSVYEHISIEQAFRSHIEARDEEDSVLLIKAGTALELQQFLNLCQMAQAAGFDEVQIAGEPVKEVMGLIPGQSMQQSNNSVFPVL
ncbi:biopolymer transporter ExbD [Opitutales bacterium]|jgi:biopolymer transport protein ExbD|nr:biopolymer transporter ExbD [Opitutales bacterium]MDB2681873.1 biopolymer transporter ExbD [Opitutales bacterium]